MEKLTLIPQHHEIIVNNGSVDGAVDLFSYGPELTTDLRPLGALYVIGHRDDDSSNVGYMVSLIAALARREYYCQPELPPRDAFLRTLKKVNEVVEEFFKSSGTDLSVGIFAIAGSTVLVSKLDKFKILLARQGEVIDILNNVILFQKEHVQKRRFSSIISGSVQPGDRILAYYPSKAVTSRERFLKSYFLKLSYEELTEKIASMGQKQPSFATALLYVDMVQDASPVLTPDIPSEPLPTSEADPRPALAWSPRQHTPPVVNTVPAMSEAPRIISSEFALGTRRSITGRWLGRLRFVRLDARGKAIFLLVALVLVVAGSLGAKSLLFASPEQQKLQQALLDIQADFALAQTKIASHESAPARHILVRALTALSGYVGNDTAVRTLSADILKAMDSLDNAQEGNLSLVAHVDTQTDTIGLVTWSSSSQSVWVVTASPDHSLAVAQVSEGTLKDRTPITDTTPTHILAFKTGVLVIDANAKKVTRVIGSVTKSFILPTQETILGGSVYQDNLYLLTDTSILKVSDLDTNKPVTKQWLTTASDLAAGSLRLSVDGNIYILDKDGMLTTYYKNKKLAQIQTPLAPSGAWELFSGPQDDQLSVANMDTKRIYIIDIASGNLIKTLKIDSQPHLISMSAGPDGSVLVISKDNKIWKAQ